MRFELMSEVIASYTEILGSILRQYVITPRLHGMRHL